MKTYTITQETLDQILDNIEKRRMIFVKRALNELPELEKEVKVTIEKKENNDDTEDDTEKILDEFDKQEIRELNNG